MSLSFRWSPRIPSSNSYEVSYSRGFKRDKRLLTSTPKNPRDEHAASRQVVSKTRLYYTWHYRILLVITPGNGRRRGGGQHTTPFHSVGTHLKMPQNSSRLLGGCRNCNKVRRWICFWWPVFSYTFKSSYISNDNAPKRFSFKTLRVENGKHFTEVQILVTYIF